MGHYWQKRDMLEHACHKLDNRSLSLSLSLYVFLSLILSSSLFLYIQLKNPSTENLNLKPCGVLLFFFLNWFIFISVSAKCAWSNTAQFTDSLIHGPNVFLYLFGPPFALFVCLSVCHFTSSYTQSLIWHFELLNLDLDQSPALLSSRWWHLLNPADKWCV